MTPEEIDLLSELTIIIPTYNRPRELERSIEYWRDLPVTVHILDGSEKPIFQVGQLPGLAKFFYHHFPNLKGEDWRDNYHRRIRFSAEICRSEYVALCSDDDIFTFHGLIAALIALKNEKADVILGKSAQYLHRNNVFEWKRIYANWKSDSFTLSSDPLMRLRSTVGGSTYYGIFESIFWRSIRISSVSKKFSNIVAVENIANFLGKICCRLLVIDDYLWITNYPDKTYGNAPHKVEKFSEWLHNDINRDQVRLLLVVIEDGIRKLTQNYFELDVTAIAENLLVTKVKPKKMPFAIRLRLIIIRKALTFLSKLPLFLRVEIFGLLPSKFKRVLRTPDFVDSRTVTEELDTSDLNLIKAIEQWEKILMMPREELRLRANI